MSVEDTPAISAEMFAAQIKRVDSDTIILPLIVKVKKTTLLQRLIEQPEKG